MIAATGLCKAYGDVVALDDVSFEVDAGEIVGLLGPNGAGKTTLMKVLTGFLQPDEGQVIIDDLDVLTDTIAVQARIGYLPENAPLYPELSVQSHLKMMADLRQIPASEVPPLLARAVRATALEEHLTRPINQLSKGFRQRVGLAQTILHKPKLLILDEPTVGLDPTQIIEVRNLIRRLAGQSTVLLSTHILSEVEAVCDRVIVLLNGEVMADARLSELSSQSTTVLVLQPGADVATPELMYLPGVVTVKTDLTSDGQEYQITCRRQEDIRPAIFDLARFHNWPVKELRRESRTLETVFNELVAGTGDLVTSMENGQ